MLNVKRPFTAGVLSLILPGLGLLYLGYKKAALINFALVNLILILAILVWREPQLIEHAHYLFLGLAALSAGYAHGVVASGLRTEGDEFPNETKPSVPVQT